MVAVEREPPQTTRQTSADAIPANLRRRGGSARQVLVVTLVGTALLAVFASRDLSSWAERLSGPLAEQTQVFAAAWDRAMTGLGLTKPYDALRSAMGDFLDCHWGNGQ